MANLAPSHRIWIDEDHREVHYECAGFWTRDAMREFLRGLGRAVAPFREQGRPYNALGDLSEFVPQDRETAAAIQESLGKAQASGLQRFAIVTSSSLVRMQYKRLTAGIEVEFFESVYAAENWLRGARS